MQTVNSSSVQSTQSPPTTDVVRFWMPLNAVNTSMKELLSTRALPRWRVYFIAASKTVAVGSGQKGKVSRPSMTKRNGSRAMAKEEAEEAPGSLPPALGGERSSERRPSRGPAAFST